MKRDKAWLKKEINKVTSRIYGADFNTIKETDDLIEQLDEPQKPVVPQFVADWIERQKQPDWDYENKEDALADSIHFTLYSLEANYPETNPDVVLRKPVNEWLNDDRKNYWKLIDGVRYGYEVEKEQKYILSINITDKASNTNYETFLNKRGIFHSMENESFNREEFNWTEEEIKHLESGEILFEHFATKVEKLEE